jgi:hypothetical protein
MDERAVHASQMPTGMVFEEIQKMGVYAVRMQSKYSTSFLKPTLLDRSNEKKL